MQTVVDLGDNLGTEGAECADKGPGIVESVREQQRFWAKVDKGADGDCWLWTGATARKGYGLFRRDGGTRIHAHRRAYQDAHGTLPPDIRVDHALRCNVLCVNPDHLRPVTQKQNLENQGGAQTNSRSGVRGVYWHKGQGKWAAKVKHDQRNIHVGSFDTIEEADAAVRAKRLELFTHNDADRQ